MFPNTAQRPSEHGVNASPSESRRAGDCHDHRCALSVSGTRAPLRKNRTTHHVRSTRVHSGARVKDDGADTLAEVGKSVIHQLRDGAERKSSPITEHVERDVPKLPLDQEPHELLSKASVKVVAPEKPKWTDEDNNGNLADLGQVRVEVQLGILPKRAVARPHPASDNNTDLFLLDMPTSGFRALVDLYVV